jgi:hypothetical protein
MPYTIGTTFQTFGGIMRIKTPAAAALACMLLAGCTSLSPAGEKVRVTSNPEAVRGCKLIGEIHAASGWGGMAQTAGEHSSMNALKNEAAKKGADTVLMINSHSGWGGASQRGEGYFCGSQNTAASQ